MSKFSGKQRTFAFDSLKRLSSATNPEDGTTNYSSYDSQGNLLAKTHVGDVTTNYLYDAQNRVTSKSYTSRTYTNGAAPLEVVATPAAVYCYDGNVVNTSFTCSAASPVIPYSIGRLTGSGNSVSVTKYASYDALGRVTASQQTPNGQSSYLFSYTYNPAGGLTSITYPSNRTVSYLYDAAGRASAAKNGAASSTDNYATIGSYWPHGAVNQMTLGNTQTETSVYNDRLQPASLTVSGNLLALNYYYCTNLVLSCTTNNGNLMSEVIGAGKYSLNLTQNFTYDGVNRLQMATETGTGGWTQTQGYDQWGNRWLASYAGLPPPSTSVPDATAFPGTNGNNNRMSLSGVAYDTAANLQVFNTADLRYDAENRLVKATKNSTVYTYGYDCEGRRVARTSPNGTTTYVYDAQGQLAAEYGPAIENPDTGRRYLTADHLGSTRLVTDASGNDVVRYDYLPFGEEIAVGTHGRTSAMGYGATTGLKQEFTGKERDAETGLDYFGARYNSSAQGRFTGVDPELIPRDITNPQIWNKYAYTLNNPLSNFDPDGRASVPAEVQQLLQKYAPTALGALSQAARRANIVTAVLDLERRTGVMPPMTVPSAETSDAEKKQGRDVAAMTGNDIIHVDKLSNQGFDAFQVVGSIFNPQGLIPTELKGLSSANPLRVLEETVDTERAANNVTLPNGDKLTGVQIFIAAPNMNANAVTAFAKNGPLPTIVGRSSVQKVTVTTSNGTVTIQNEKVTTKCTKTGSDGSCQ